MITKPLSAILEKSENGSKARGLETGNILFQFSKMRKMWILKTRRQSSSILNLIIKHTLYRHLGRELSQRWLDACRHSNHVGLTLFPFQYFIFGRSIKYSRHHTFQFQQERLINRWVIFFMESVDQMIIRCVRFTAK